jgi:hypothetical protein
VVAVLATILSTAAAIVLVWQLTKGETWAGAVLGVLVLPSSILAFFSHRLSIFIHGDWVAVLIFAVLQLGYCYALTCLVWSLFQTSSS